ncbi:hypothetical protein AMAG_10209 [Allomyces macrogynus ATCC 38327]|uniref:Uncharacterized protein n=1 Tax=Allomyces macrogynus (strain ATCC 38327) TaxID=578462 RepID=A0A0L0SQU9_ALLM3|nr:hypothetical protein AMAG_10209 [Allomyces macrogynus ATCC 38327]|eukprot:KNE64876.1 hypothetical protein AMAG_10209 [Allomyces macrogynus ATCC 38327]
MSFAPRTPPGGRKTAAAKPTPAAGSRTKTTAGSSTGPPGTAKPATSATKDKDKDAKLTTTKPATTAAKKPAASTTRTTTTRPAASAASKPAASKTTTSAASKPASSGTKSSTATKTHTNAGRPASSTKPHAGATATAKPGSPARHHRAGTPTPARTPSRTSTPPVRTATPPARSATATPPARTPSRLSRRDSSTSASDIEESVARLSTPSASVSRATTPVSAVESAEEEESEEEIPAVPALETVTEGVVLDVRAEEKENVPVVVVAPAVEGHASRDAGHADVKGDATDAPNAPAAAPTPAVHVAQVLEPVTPSIPEPAVAPAKDKDKSRAVVPESVPEVVVVTAAPKEDAPKQDATKGVTKAPEPVPEPVDVAPAAPVDPVVTAAPIAAPVVETKSQEPEPEPKPVVAETKPASVPAAPAARVLAPEPEKAKVQPAQAKVEPLQPSTPANIEPAEVPAPVKDDKSMPPVFKAVEPELPVPAEIVAASVAPVAPFVIAHHDAEPAVVAPAASVAEKNAEAPAAVAAVAPTPSAARAQGGAGCGPRKAVEEPAAVVMTVEKPVEVAQPAEKPVEVSKEPTPVVVAKPVESPAPVKVVAEPVKKAAEEPAVVAKAVEQPAAVAEKPVATVKAVEEPIAVVKAVEKPVAVTKPAEEPVASPAAVKEPVVPVKAVEKPVPAVVAEKPEVAAASAPAPVAAEPKALTALALFSHVQALTNCAVPFSQVPVEAGKKPQVDPVPVPSAHVEPPKVEQPRAEPVQVEKPRAAPAVKPVPVVVEPVALPLPAPAVEAAAPRAKPIEEPRVVAAAPTPAKPAALPTYEEATATLTVVEAEPAATASSATSVRDSFRELALADPVVEKAPVHAPVPAVIDPVVVAPVRVAPAAFELEKDHVSAPAKVVEVSPVVAAPVATPIAPAIAVKDIAVEPVQESVPELPAEPVVVKEVKEHQAEVQVVEKAVIVEPAVAVVVSAVPAVAAAPAAAATAVEPVTKLVETVPAPVAVSIAEVQAAVIDSKKAAEAEPEIVLPAELPAPVVTPPRDLPREPVARPLSLVETTVSEDMPSATLKPAPTTSSVSIEEEEERARAPPTSSWAAFIAATSSTTPESDPVRITPAHPDSGLALADSDQERSPSHLTDSVHAATTDNYSMAVSATDEAHDLGDASAWPDHTSQYMRPGVPVPSVPRAPGQTAAQVLANSCNIVARIIAQIDDERNKASIRRHRLRTVIAPVSKLWTAVAKKRAQTIMVVSVPHPQVLAEVVTRADELREGVDTTHQEWGAPRHKKPWQDVPLPLSPTFANYARGLRHLELHDVQLGDMELRILANNIDSLVHLALHECVVSVDRGAAEFTALLRANRDTLRALHMVSSRLPVLLDDALLPRWSQACGRLEYLYLSFSHPGLPSSPGGANGAWGWGAHVPGTPSGNSGMANGHLEDFSDVRSVRSFSGAIGGSVAPAPSVASTAVTARHMLQRSSSMRSVPAAFASSSRPTSTALSSVASFNGFTSSSSSMQAAATVGMAPVRRNSLGSAILTPAGLQALAANCPGLSSLTIDVPAAKYLSLDDLTAAMYQMRGLRYLALGTTPLRVRLSAVNPDVLQPR